MKPAGRLILSFVAVVAVFAFVGPLASGLIVSLIILARFPVSEAGQLFVLVMTYAFILGVPFMLLIGLMTAASGFWFRLNGLVVPIVVSCFAAIAVTVFMIAIGQLVPTPPMFGISALPSTLLMYATFALLPSVLCWYLTRRLVRSTWQSRAEPAR